jgi:hypothetical protein
MTDSETKNLEAIAKAIDKHNADCEFPPLEVLMNPYEVDRLDWDTIKGVPINGDDSIGTGRFRIVCAGNNDSNVEEEEEVVDAVSKDRMYV